MEKKQNKTHNLTGFINLNECENNNYQFIYATQSLYSFFCIYAKFTVKKGYLKDIDLFLMNYNGPFEYKFKTNKIDVLGLNNNILRLGCKLSAFGQSDSAKNETPLNIEVSEIKEIFFTRDPAHFNTLRNCSVDVIDGYSSSRSSFDIEEDRDDMHTILRERLNDLISSGKSFSNEKIEKFEAIVAVGHNCRVSRMKNAGG